MSVTGSEVIAQTAAALNYTSGGIFTAAQELAAVNAAIAGAWPALSQVAIDSSITIAAATFEYTPSATPDVDAGFNVAHGSLPNQPRVHLRRLSQRRDGTAWTIIVPQDIVAQFTGQTLYLQYEKRLAVLAAIGDSIELPLDYLWKAAAYYLCLFAISKKANFDTGQYEAMIQVYERLMVQSLSAAATNQKELPREIEVVSEVGQSFVTGRYGENIVTNP